MKLAPVLLIGLGYLGLIVQFGWGGAVLALAHLGLMALASK